MERTRGIISIGNSGILRGGQVFLALDIGEKITRFQLTELPMPAAVIKQVMLDLQINKLAGRSPAKATQHFKAYLGK